MSDDPIDRLVSNLSDAEVLALVCDWHTWARPEQLPPQGNWLTWLLLGGRGSGKTRAGAEWAHELAWSEPPVAPIALVAETLSQAQSVMVEGVSGILNTGHPDRRPRFDVGRNALIWPNGATAKLMSASQPESFRGPQFAAAWCDELAKWPHAEAAWDMLQFGLRLGERPRQLVTTTPKPTRLLKGLIADPRTVTVTMRTSDNAQNLAPTFLDEVVGRYHGTLLGRQELDGELIEAREGALWTWETIERAKNAPSMPVERIIVAVDPAVTAGTSADACGIVVVGSAGNLARVLADETDRGVRPLEWARKVIRTFHRFAADAVVAEVNQGGDLVRELLAQIDANVPVRAVRATRGKWLRAEPVAALYEQGRVSHAPGLDELEDEMLAFDPDGRADGHSPDRLDALVWGLTELLLNQSVPRVREI